MGKRSKSVIKRIHQNERRRVRNRVNVSKYKSAVKRLEAVLEKNDPEAARTMLPEVLSAIDAAVTKNALSKNAAARKKSSLARRVNALG